MGVGVGPLPGCPGDISERLLRVGSSIWLVEEVVIDSLHSLNS